MTYIDKLNQQLEEVMKEIKELKIKNTECNQLLSRYDKELVDLEHLLENRKHYKLNAVLITKVAMEISDIRNKRRDVKDELEQISILIGYNQSIEATIRKKRSELQKISDKQNTPVYNPRSKVYERLGITIERVVIQKETNK